MSTHTKQIVDDGLWQRGRFARGVLPFTGDAAETQHKISDSVKLRISTALQTSLHVRDVIKGFAAEVRRIVPGVSVRYRHGSSKLAVDDGARAMNRYSYEMNLVGKFLGEISFSRHDALSEDELEILEVLLCSLIYPLKNALQYERALRIALKDPLTGVSNRASMMAHINHHISLAQRQNTPLAILMIDIDRFKSVNDGYGHIVGDIVLTHVAKHIVSCTRTSDGVFRYGGEEFVVVLPSTAGAGAELLADRIRGDIESMSIEAVPIQTQITVSVGMAHYVPGESEVELLQRADDMLLAAKRRGRNQVVVADASADPVLLSSR